MNKIIDQINSIKQEISETNLFLINNKLQSNTNVFYYNNNNKEISIELAMNIINQGFLNVKQKLNQ